MFKVGQRVVCVKSIYSSIHNTGIKEGNVYTITGVYICPKCGNVDVSWGAVGYLCPDSFLMCHCDTKHHFGINELTVDAGCFAPIQEYGDSMSIAMELIQDMERVDKPVNPVKTNKPQEAEQQ